MYEAITGELRYARTSFENVRKVLLRNYNRSFDVIAEPVFIDRLYRNPPPSRKKKKNRKKRIKM